MAREKSSGKICATILAVALSATLMAGCAATEGGNMPPPIPEGKGRLILDAGGINELNFFVINQETEEEVYSFTPRPPSTSPSAYERSVQEFRLFTYLDPGVYTVVVNTDLEQDIIEIPDVEIVIGEEKYVPVQVGRFMVNVTRNGARTQVPFLIWDYQLRTVLGRGMTSTQVRHFIARPGIYKIRIEMLSAAIDHIRDVEVNMGRVTPVYIELAPSVDDSSTEPGEGQEQP